MAAVAEMLKATEAAVVARVSLRDVNRAIDERILPEALFSIDNGRYVLAGACLFISFYFESAKRLTSEERLLAIKKMGPKLASSRKLPWASLLLDDWTVHDEFLTIDLKPFLRSTSERLSDLEAARAMVTSSDEILSGTPVISNTRVPVYDVAASLTAGHPVERILEAYPSINEENVRLAGIYAEANPLRGRPRAPGDLPATAAIIKDCRVPRSRTA